MGFVSVAGDETRLTGLSRGLTGLSREIPELRLGRRGWGAPHSSPRRGKATEDGHEETHVAKRRHIPGPRGQGKETERALGPLEGGPRSLKDFHVGGMEPRHHPHRSLPILTARTDSIRINLESCVHQSS